MHQGVQNVAGSRVVQELTQRRVLRVLLNLLLLLLLLVVGEHLLVLLQKNWVVPHLECDHASLLVADLLLLLRSEL